MSKEMEVVQVGDIDSLPKKSRWCNQFNTPEET